MNASRSIICLMILALAGCVIPTSRKVDYVPPVHLAADDVAVLHIYRVRAFFASATDVDIYIDGELVVELGNGDGIAVPVEPGVRTISASGWRSDSYAPVYYYAELQPPTEHEFLAGSHYYLRWSYRGDRRLSFVSPEMYEERR